MAKQTTSTKTTSAPKRKAKSEAPEPVTGVVAKAPVAATDIEVPLQRSRPSHDAIAARAFELYQMRGGSDGSDLGDWLRAERELHP